MLCAVNTSYKLKTEKSIFSHFNNLFLSRQERSWQDYGQSQATVKTDLCTNLCITPHKSKIYTLSYTQVLSTGFAFAHSHCSFPTIIIFLKKKKLKSRA